MGVYEDNVTNEPLPATTEWDESPKGCWNQHPLSREICQLPPDGHTLHKRKHPNGIELECWTHRPTKQHEPTQDARGGAPDYSVSGNENASQR